jgi:hypothetical protein
MLLRSKAAPATRAQRLSATRAAHRLIRRTKETHALGQKLVSQAHSETKADLGFDESSERHKEYRAAFDANPSYKKARKL